MSNERPSLVRKVTAIFLSFINEIFHIFMYKYIHKPIYNTQTPEMPYVPVDSLLTITYRCLPNCQLGKAFRKPLILGISCDLNCFTLCNMGWDSVLCAKATKEINASHKTNLSKSHCKLIL